MQINWDIFSPDKIKKAYILLRNKNRAYIYSYIDMQVLFCKRSYVVDGEGKETELPQIIYKVKMDDGNKKLLYSLYQNNNNLGSISSKPALFIIEPMGKEERFTCRCSVESYPPYLKGETIVKAAKYNSDIKIKISMESPDQPLYLLLKDPGILYEDEKEEIKKLDRFEIMDIE